MGLWPSLLKYRVSLEGALRDSIGFQNSKGSLRPLTGVRWTQMLALGSR